MGETLNKRIVGLDILRSVAMLMIVIWHFYWHGIGSNFFPMNGGGITNYLLSQFIIVCCSVCVNTFVLISSYFLLDKPFNGGRIMQLWLQVVFYSVVLYLLSIILRPGTFSINDTLSCIFPISSYTYWFFSDYIGFVCLAPFLAKAAKALTQKEYQIFLVVLLLTCTTFTLSFPLGNTMGAKKGYSLIWFICLFFWGGYFKRFNSSLKGIKAGRLYLIGGVLVTLFCIGKNILKLILRGQGLEVEFPAYNSLSFIISIPLFLFFLNKDFRQTRFTSFLIKCAPYTFGVYLISENVFIREFLWKKIQWVSFSDHPLFIPAGLAVCIAVFLLCCGMDKSRAVLFKITGISRFCDSVSNMLKVKLDSTFSKKSIH